MAGRRGLAAVLPLILLLFACGPRPPVVIGRPGLNPGEFDTPRGLDARFGLLAVVDKSGRVQVLHQNGTLLREFRCMPEDAVRGFPLDVQLTGADGSLMVVHTHRGQIVFYDATGKETRALGDYGMEPGQFCLPQRITTTPLYWYVTDFGYPECRRIHRFRSDGTFEKTIGGKGTELEFHRPMGIARSTLPPRSGGTRGKVTWVADANHRLVRITGEVLHDVVGEKGTAVGQLQFPTGVAAHPGGGVIVCEAGNHRIQWFGDDGVSRGTFGGQGTGPGEFHGPYDLAIDGGTVWVADTDNHRIQGFRLADVSWDLGKKAP